MKAKQLMLGNYALYNGLVVRVRNIHDNVFLDGEDESVEVVYDDGVVVLVDPCSLEPIPLTPEILEKNGFSRNGLDIAIFDRKGGDDFVGAANLEFVHELQNALRLCGIEYEITL